MVNYNDVKVTEQSVDCTYICTYLPHEYSYDDAVTFRD